MIKPTAQRERGLLDTSAVLALHRIPDPQHIPAEPLISAITLAELSVGPLVVDSEPERASRQVQVQEVEADFAPLPFDAAAARAFAGVSADMRRAGRKTSARAFDALIAAVAVANDLPLYTCNPADFKGIRGLDVIAIPVPK